MTERVHTTLHFKIKDIDVDVHSAKGFVWMDLTDSITIQVDSIDQLENVANMILSICQGIREDQAVA